MMNKIITILALLCSLVIGCIDIPTETEDNQGEELRIILTAKAGAVYSVTPYGKVKFDKIETAPENDSTEIKTIIHLHRINSDSVSIIISKDSKRLFGRVNNSANVIIKEFILDNGTETRIIKF